ncbi:MAG: hypothetical protein AAFZ15_22810 [Bacteroidota bacterium]
MIGQKLTKILQSLKPDEFRRLKRAVNSPYFATNSRLLDLYNYLRKYYPDFAEEKLQKEKLYKKLYPGKPFNDGVLRVLIREFTVVVEDFMLLERMRSDKHLRKRTLVKEYGKRRLFEYFRKGTFELLDETEMEHVADMEHYRERVALYQDYCFHELSDVFQKSDDSLEKMMDSLDRYFILAKYRFVQILRNANIINKKKATYRFFDVVKNNRGNILENNELVILYELINQLHETNDEKYFFELKKLLFPVIEKIRKTDRRIIFYLGLNFCSRQFRFGKTEYIGESLDWYKKGLDSKFLLLRNETITDVTFSNIVKVACYEKEYTWAEDFIEKYNRYLKDNIREDALTYSKATLCIERKEFVQAIRLLSNNIYGSRYHFKIRVALVKAAFEQALIDPQYHNFLQSAIESYAKYLQRDTTNSDHRTIPVKNFLKITEGLAKRILAREDKDNIINWFNKKVHADKEVELKFWLKEKVKNLK